MRFLVIFLLLHVGYFSLLLGQRQHAYYHAVSAVFGKVCRFASEEVVLRLVNVCLFYYTYGCEACGLRSSDVRSLEFTVNRFLMKLFKTTNIQVIEDCVGFFNFELPSSLIVKMQRNFQLKYYSCENLLCKLFQEM